MTMNFKRRLPIPMEIREEMPLSADMAARKPAFDAEVAAIIRGESPRRLLVIGPCSADREDSVLDYVTRLAKLADEVKDKYGVELHIVNNGEVDDPVEFLRGFSWCRASTPTSRARAAPATRAFSTTQTPMRRQTSSRA